MRAAYLHSALRDRVGGAVYSEAPAKADAVRLPKRKSHKPALRYPCKAASCLETILRIIRSNGPAEPAELRRMLHSEGFFKLLNTEAPAEIEILRRFFSASDANQKVETGPMKASAAKPILRCETEDVMPVLGPLLVPLQRYARTLTKQRAAAEDLVQDCLEQVIRNWPQRRVDGDTPAWIFTIMRNLACTGFRRQSRRGCHMTIEDSSESAFAIPPLQEDALLHRDLENGMKTLSKQYRNVLWLISREDMSYAQAADLLGVPVGTVRSRLARARENLLRTVNGDAV